MPMRIQKPTRYSIYLRLCPLCRKARGKIQSISRKRFQGVCPNCGASGPTQENYQEAFKNQPAWGAAIPIASLGNLSTSSLLMPKLSLRRPSGLAASQVDMLISWYSGELNRISTLGVAQQRYVKSPRCDRESGRKG